MSSSKTQELLLNLAEAESFIESISDPGIKILLETSRYQVMRCFIQFSDHPLSEKEFLDQLPSAPFDMLFFLKVVNKLLENKYLVTELLSGNIDAANQG